MPNTYEQQLQAQHEAQLQKEREAKAAYSDPSVANYTASAAKNALPNNLFNGRADYNFINKVRAIADSGLADRNASHRPETNPFTDVPIRVQDNFANSLGSKVGYGIGAATRPITSAASSVFGASGVTSKLVDAGSGALSYAQDHLKIITDSPWIGNQLKKLSNFGHTPIKMSDTNGFFAKAGGSFATSLKKLLGDFADILDEWYHDPKTLCCLIKSLAALAKAAAQKNGIKNFDAINKKYFSGNVRIAELVDMVDFFDKLIAILEIIKSFLLQTMNYNFALNIDLGLAMSKASIGALMALLAALQQMLQDRIYTKMLEFVKNYTSETVRSCLPIERLLRLIADWMSGPKGLFKYIERLVDAYMLGFNNSMQKGFDEGAKLKMMDIAALDKLILLLKRMRDAMFNLELCVEADFNNDPELNQPHAGPSGSGRGTPRDNWDPTLTEQIKTGNRPVGSVIYPTDREIKAFIINRLGESDSFANQVLDSAAKSTDSNFGLAAGGADNAGGDPTANLKMAIGDCARTLNSQRIGELAALIADWEII